MRAAVVAAEQAAEQLLELRPDARQRRERGEQRIEDGGRMLIHSVGAVLIAVARSVASSNTRPRTDDREITERLVVPI